MDEETPEALKAARSATVRRKPVPPPQQAQLPSRKGNLLDQWKCLSRRTRIIIIAVALAIIVLIIGLAAGLSTRKHTQNLPLPSGHGGPYNGDLTYYAPGLGACGLTSTDSDKIVSISHIVFDAVSTGSDPNQNPLCGKKIRARRDNKSVDLTVVDRCTGCQPTDLDVTIDTFAMLADVDSGRVDVVWNWLEDVPASAQG
ncbi:hypothetical protein PV05_01950 [Exophiala xenobiotica]|uniref:RlpA-like protein double-psi beta-barrel domain-containing protein n=1 Tax=Exophiala xenobiotica TaxID=348802 RepID=A0A0D2FPG5_9EURO|nr:uncharacterized protein PV05_01950 [Exophiala xenobiotica]KIW61879.1 hypothetical protein PV05_01950 [Exophiala xenobiotica]MBV36046.1 hypothetical protein [Rickettsiales bacterium]